MNNNNNDNMNNNKVTDEDEWDLVDTNADAVLPSAVAAPDINRVVSSGGLEKTPELTDNMQVEIMENSSRLSVTTAEVHVTEITENALSNLLDANSMFALFPTKDEAKRQTWLSTLHTNEFETFKDLDSLDNEGWNLLSLPLAVKAVLKSEVKKRSCEMTTPTAISDTDKSCHEPREDTFRPVTQVDCVVMDISSSMRARSRVDVDKTREDGKQPLCVVLAFGVKH